MVKLTHIYNVGWTKKYICHFTDLLTKEENHSDTFIIYRYNLAKARAESIGGEPYLNCGNFIFNNIETIDLEKLLHIKPTEWGTFEDSCHE